jgi:hypothetical protein
LFRVQLNTDIDDARRITARPTEASNEAEFYWVCATLKK